MIKTMKKKDNLKKYSNCAMKSYIEILTWKVLYECKYALLSHELILTDHVK